MTRTTVTRTIDAPIEVVFKTISDINNYSKAVPDIVNVEMLSDIRSGVGTRFRETRLMKGKEAKTELEVTEFVENDHVRMVTDSHGTVWDSIFAVKSMDRGTNLELTMDAKAHKFLAKLMNPMIKGMIRKALEKDMDAVKTYCESLPKSKTCLALGSTLSSSTSKPEDWRSELIYEKTVSLP